MAVRDLLWGCPLCRAPGSIRRDGPRERCRACGASFRRGRGAIIVAENSGSEHHRTAAEWLGILGPVEAPEPDANGVIIAPQRVRVKLTRNQKPLHFGGELLGWVEVYEKARAGTMYLRVDGLHFQPDRGEPVTWAPDDIMGLQPASSSLQLVFREGTPGLPSRMTSVRFLDGSVRLWTQALSDLVRLHHSRNGLEVFELQPFVRTRALARSVP